MVDFSVWVDERLERCFQLMESEDSRLLDEWVAYWSDLVVFEEIVPVISSAEATPRIMGTSGPDTAQTFPGTLCGAKEMTHSLS